MHCRLIIPDFSNTANRGIILVHLFRVYVDSTKGCKKKPFYIPPQTTMKVIRLLALLSGLCYADAGWVTEVFTVTTTVFLPVSTDFNSLSSTSSYGYFHNLTSPTASKTYDLNFDGDGHLRFGKGVITTELPEISTDIPTDSDGPSLQIPNETITLTVQIPIESDEVPEDTEWEEEDESETEPELETYLESDEESDEEPNLIPLQPIPEPDRTSSDISTEEDGCNSSSQSPDTEETSVEQPTTLKTSPEILFEAPSSETTLFASSSPEAVSATSGPETTPSAEHLRIVSESLPALGPVKDQSISPQSGTSTTTINPITLSVTSWSTTVDTKTISKKESLPKAPKTTSSGPTSGSTSDSTRGPRASSAKSQPKTTPRPRSRSISATISQKHSPKPSLHRTSSAPKTAPKLSSRRKLSTALSTSLGISRAMTPAPTPVSPSNSLSIARLATRIHFSTTSFTVAVHNQTISYRNAGPLRQTLPILLLVPVLGLVLA